MPITSGWHDHDDSLFVERIATPLAYNEMRYGLIESYHHIVRARRRVSVMVVIECDFQKLVTVGLFRLLRSANRRLPRNIAAIYVVSGGMLVRSWLPLAQAAAPRIFPLLHIVTTEAEARQLHHQQAQQRIAATGG